MSALAVSLILVVVLILIGMNVGVSFLVSTILYEFITGGSISSFARTAFSANNSYSLLAIPLFMLAGLLMERSGIAGGLVDWCESFLGKVKGGMGAVIPVVSMLFGTLCGSGVATVSTVGSILIPRLERLGWDKRYTAALCAASAPLGFMIPPNMNAIIFSLVSTATVSALFLAAVVPGILWGVGYIILNRIVYAKWYDPSKAAAYRDTPSQSYDLEAAMDHPTLDLQRPGFLKATKAAIPAFIMPIIILGGIYSGKFTPTEAGAVSALYALIAGVFIYRQFTPKSLFASCATTSTSLGTLMIIFPFAMIFSKMMVLEGVPAMMTNLITGISDNRIVLLLVIDLMLLIAGCFFDAPILTLVIPPILMPTMNALGVGPTQFGVIVFMAIGIGAFTPPMAVNLFVATKVGNVQLRDMIPPLMPMLLFVAIPVMLLVTFVPALSTWLPQVVMGIPIL